MKRPWLVPAVVALTTTLLIIGCAQPTPSPTAAPAAPTKAPAAQAPTQPALAPTQAAPQPTAAPKVAYPERGKAVTLIVPFAAGGGGDTSTRIFTPFLEKELGVSIQVVNKPGAATQTGMTELVKAKPDGYTLGVTPLPSILVPYLDEDRKTGYARKDFAPIANYANLDNTVAVNASLPYKDMKGLIDAAKANPGKIKVADAGILANAHLLTLALENETGAKFASVHFASGSEMMTALLGGHVDASNPSATEVMSAYKAGTARVLATAGQQQSRFLPDVKTLAAQGFKSSTAYVIGFSAPGGTPKEIIEILNAAAKKAMANPDLTAKMVGSAMEPAFMDTGQYTEFWAKYETGVMPLIKMGKASTK